MAKATYLFITLLFIIGLQIASSKSVGELVKDTSFLVKRQAEDNEGEVTTEQSTTPIVEDSTTTMIPDTDEDAATVKPLEDENNDKKPDEKKNKQVKNPKKPVIPELLNRGGEPSTNLLPPMPFTCIPPSYYGQSPPLPQYPPAFAQPSPWTYNFLPPPIPQYNIPTGHSGYDYPIPSGPAFSTGGFGSASASASANGQGGSVSTSTSPGGSVHTSFGIGTRGSFPTDGSSSSGPFPAIGSNGGVSQSASSHSSSGPNGHESSSSFSNSGPNGIQSSYSHTGPNGVQQGTYGVPYPNGNNGIPGSFSHSGPNGVSAANGGAFPNVHNSGSFVSVSGTIPPGGQPSFVGIRGSFPADDGESVAIEVDGPEGTHISAPEGAKISGSFGRKPAGAPQYPGPNYAYSGPGFASSGAFAPAYYSGPTYSPYGVTDINAIYQNYFAQLQAQQAAFQRQIQQQIAAQQQAIWDQSNQVDSNFNNPNGPASAFSSISLGPQGGYQQGAISPARPGIFSRFGEDVPAPSGNSYGVFSSSSSSSSTGPDGKTISHKSASVGVNDNGKISVKTVHDP